MGFWPSGGFGHWISKLVNRRLFSNRTRKCGIFQERIAALFVVESKGGARTNGASSHFMADLFRFGILMFTVETHGTGCLPRLALDWCRLLD